MNKLTFFLENEQQTVLLGGLLARFSQTPFIFYLSGSLGAGKTTLTRGFLQAKGHQGVVKSPTYTLVEPYSLPELTVYHFDLYRIADPEELEFIGIRDYFDPKTISLIEWPEQGARWLPSADIVIALEYSGLQRKAQLTAHSEKGKHVLWLLSHCAEFSSFNENKH